MGLAGVLALALLAPFSAAALGAEPPTDESYLIGERPSVNGEPTQIEIGLFIMDVDEIDDVKQRFSIDLFLGARWFDPRLALPESERQGQKRFMSLDDIWTPRVLFLNNRGLELHLREGAEVDDQGTVTVMNRVAGQLSADLEFREFPFDVQTLAIDMVSYEYTTDQLNFILVNEGVKPASSFSIEGWQLKQLDPEVGVFVSPVKGEQLPRLTYYIEAKRDSDYYVLTMLVPMALIIFMAWTVFWLQPNIVPPRIAISTASIFSLIALGVSIRLGLPKVSYLTKADIFVLGCTLMVFLALAVAVIGSRWANAERMEDALKVNRIARWVYMILFFLVAGAAIFH